MKLQPGTEVTPNVRLESFLAQGAMGEVWVAEHLTLNTKVAVKFISDRLDPDEPEVLERFIREASTAAQIKSSHVVQTFDQGVMRDGTPYIVMEFLDGEELGERLAREGRLPLVEVVEIVRQTAKALQSAHKIGIVHRDIKPDNIFLATHDDELHVKVFDFGIAKHRQDEAMGRGTMSEPMVQGGAQMGLTNDGVMIGTPEFMSPEQVMSAHSVDHRADLWGLAVVAYVAITGELPFKGDDVSELCVNLLGARFAKVTEVDPTLPATLDAWFDKALARKIDDRFDSAREMADLLAGAIPGLSLSGGIPLGVSGADMRSPDPSVPPMSDPSISISDGRGMRAATFSGSAADAGLVPRRRVSPGIVAGGAALVLAIAAGAFVMASSADGGEVPSPETKAKVAAQPKPAANVAADKAEDAAGEAEPAAKATAEEPEETEKADAGVKRPAPSATVTATASQRRPFVPRRPTTKRKDPGF